MADMLDSIRSARSKNLKYSQLSGMKQREARWGYIFVSPYIVGFLVFVLVPMIASLVFSTLNFQLSEPDNIRFIGLEHWSRLFQDKVIWGGGDGQALGALSITFLFGIISLPIGLASALFLAILLNSEALLGKNIFRTLFFMPSMIPAIASVLIWQGFLNSQTGWLNRLIEFLTPIDATGTVSGLLWLDDPKLLYFAYTFMGIWATGNAMLLTLASLQGVPTDLYEASSIDGAGWWRRLWNITMPMISPVVFYNLIIGTIGLLQYFLVPYALNGGDGSPQGYSMFYLVYLWKQAFAFANMGYGSALAWFLFIVAMALTVVLFWTSKYWVYYAGERE